MSPSSYENGIGRRDILCSGGSAIFSSLIAALLGGTKPARAQTIAGSVPDVDRATVRVVTDNYHFALSPSGKIGDVEVGRIVFPLSDQPPGKVLLSEFGLSIHLETQRGNESQNVLIDFGYSSPTLLNNIDILGIDPAKLDAIKLNRLGITLNSFSHSVTPMIGVREPASQHTLLALAILTRIREA